MGVWSLSAAYDARPAGADFVTDGLVLNLDAGTTASYPGSGTTWTNLVAGGPNGTLTNGPTFSTDQLVFNGSNQAVTLSSAISIANNFSYEAWCRPTTTHEIDALGSRYGGVGGQRYLFPGTFVSDPNAGAGISIGTNGVSAYEHHDGWMPPMLVQSATISSTVATQVVVVYSGKTPTLYINGAFQVTGTTSGQANVYAQVPALVADGYGYYQGGIYKVHIYNRALSAAEVTRNFNGLRGRYGI